MKIRNYREKTGTTYKFIAENILGMNYSTFRNFLSGNRISEEKLTKIKELLEEKNF
jgi:hypothetical protein